MIASRCLESPLRVLSVHYAHQVGGVNTWNQRMIAAFQRRSDLGVTWTTTLIGNPSAYAAAVASIPAEIRRHFQPLVTANEQGDRLNQWHAAGIALREHPEWLNYDVVIPNDMRIGWLLPEVIAARCGRRPAVVGAIHCDQDYHYRFCGEGSGTLEAVFGVSRRIQAEFARLYPRAPAPEYIPYGVPVADEPPRLQDNGPLKLVFCGRLFQYHKRSLDLIPLIDELERLRVDYELHIVGDGECLAPLQQELLRRAPRRVRFHAPLPPLQVPAYLARHHVILNLSDFEGTSISMLEGMGQGLVPVVTAIASGVSDIIQPGLNGWSVPVGDMYEMAARLQQLHMDRSLLQRAGNAARQAVAANYNLDHNAEAMARLLWRAAAQPRATYRANYRALWLGRLDRRHVPGWLTLPIRRLQRLIESGRSST